MNIFINVANLRSWLKQVRMPLRKVRHLQQTLLFIDSIMNYPSQTDVIYFDIVFHGILLNKLPSHSTHICEDAMERAREMLIGALNRVIQFAMIKVVYPDQVSVG